MEGVLCSSEMCYRVVSVEGVLCCSEMCTEWCQWREYCVVVRCVQSGVSGGSDSLGMLIIVKDHLLLLFPLMECIVLPVPCV